MEKSKTRENLDYAFWSLHLLKSSINELKVIYKERPADEAALTKSALFQKFHMYSMYCLIMEYCKLLERNEKNKNFASLSKLNDDILADKGVQYENLHNSIKSRIEVLSNSTFRIKIKNLRNKEFAHTDKNKASHQLTIKSFTGEEMKILLEHFEEMSDIHKQCAGQYDTSWLYMQDESTEHFIAKYVKYKKFYMAHHKHDIPTAKTQS